MATMKQLMIAVLLFWLPAVGLLAQPLVDADWLSQQLQSEQLVVLDIRGAASRQSRADYIRGHIPGAVYSSYERGGWRTKNAANINGQLPSPEALSALIGGLGIGNDNHVVIVSAGGRSRDTASATRIYWTFKVLGHDAVSLLDGGMQAWRQAGRDAADPNRFPIEQGDNTRAPRVFETRLRTEMLVSKAQMQAALNQGTTLLDHRPYRQFSGASRHRLARRSGTIPGAQNLPERSLTQAGSSLFKSVSALEKLLADTGAANDAAQINFCNTGHWASLGWFVSHELVGNRQAKLYDGSMLEWSADKNLPMSVAP